MTLAELHQKLKDLGIGEDKYFLHGLFGSTIDDDKLALTIRMGKYTAEYVVYYSERNEKHIKGTFTNESEACEYILKKLVESNERIQDNFGIEISEYKTLTTGADGGHTYLTTEIEYKGQKRKLVIYFADKSDERKLTTVGKIKASGRLYDQGIEQTLSLLDTKLTEWKE
mgnify:CR=1 FL=1